MKRLFIFIFTLLEVSAISAQKKEIDMQAINTWPTLTGYDISNDGKYVWYAIDSGRTGSALFISNASGRRKISYNRCYSPKFSNDCKYVLFNSEKGIYKIRLYDFKESLLSGARQLKVSENSSWITYCQNNKMKLVSIEGGQDRIINGALECWFDPMGKNLLIKYADSLCLLNIANNRTKKIFSGAGVGTIAFNNSGDQLLFSVVNDDTSTIYKYSSSADRAELIISNSSPAIKKGILLSGQGFGFNNTSDIIFLKYRIFNNGKSLQDSNLTTGYLNIWSYSDRFLQSEQALKREHKEDEFNPDRLYQGVMPVSGKEVFLLENADTSVHLSPGNQYAIIKSVNNDQEVYWNESEWPSFQLVSLKDGTRTNFLKSNRNVYDVALSPSEKFITWADSSLKEYYCYNIENKQTTVLTAGLRERGKNWAAGFILDGWLEDDSFIICRDDYDLWQIDPLGVIEPICITSGYGKLRKIRFALIDDQNSLTRKKRNDEMIVAAMEDSTMDNGFYKIKLSSISQPQRLLWGPCLYYFPGLFSNPPNPPIKALNSNAYLIQQQSDRESRNLFLTKDFIHQDHITDIHPENDFNWHNAKLINWTTKHGERGKGILYVPDNLDTATKYPIIFNYYEIRSGELRKYQIPELSAVNINIPQYLNKGYLVFVPDIPRKKGHTFENALDIIESGALYLVNKYKWIDRSRMGLQGQSFGGTVTNFVATHSGLFAAAQSSSGRTDLISCYGGLGFGGKSLQGVIEVFQNNMGYTPWDRPDVYINNSPIFGAGNSQTPLLIAHGKDDAAVNVGQAIELFTALRRTGKKVWFLQYAAGHVLDSYSRIGRDFILRQQQFFDHYLKGAPAPLWMTGGAPAKLKSSESELSMESLNRIP